MSTTTSTAVVVYSPGDVDPEHVALAGFLGGYRGPTRDAYAFDLRQFVAFCEQRQLRIFEVHRSDIEAFGHHLEARGRATATIARRLCTITGFYRYAEGEGLIAHSPAVHVRRPRIDYESHAIGLDRNEVGSLLVAAGLGPAAEHALISLLALNGLRVSEAIGANIEALAVERGHRTLTILRKGAKTVTVPLAPRVHHRRPRRRSAAARRPRGRLLRRSTHDHALRPGQSLPRPPRHLYSLHLHRRSRPLTRRSGRQQSPPWRPPPAATKTPIADSDCFPGIPGDLDALLLCVGLSVPDEAAQCW